MPQRLTEEKAMKLSIDRFTKVGFGTLLVATFLGMSLGVPPP